MENYTTPRFDEKQKMTDLLSSQKFLTSVYNSYCCESATGAVKNCLSSILADEHQIQQEIFSEMSNRGWYTLEKADDTKIASAKQKFSPSHSVEMMG